MTITLEYRNPNSGHCDVAVFINGALTGTLRLGQEDVVGFQQIVQHGCRTAIDTFNARGKSLPPGDPRGEPEAGAQQQLDARAHVGDGESAAREAGDPRGEREVP